jgi:hypothetical protein
MILSEFPISYKYGDTIVVKPIFDVHLGNTYCDERAFREYLKDSDNHTYFLGGGDLLDSIITKDINRYVKHADASKGDAIIDDQVAAMAALLMPYRDRIIGIGSGNHESAIAKHCGTNPTRRLCEQLKVPSLGFSWMVRLQFRETEGRGRAVILRGHHGWGGGSRTQGADLTKYSRDTMYWDADIFLYGHVHRRQSDKIDRMSMSGTTLIPKPKHIFLCGTFLKTFSLTDEATYSEEKGYPPVSIGGLNIKITPTVRWVRVENDL